MLTDERTTVGLDVHARSVVAEAVDWDTGQVYSQGLVPANDEVLAWVGRLPGPVAVTYQAGRPGSGWPARSLRRGLAVWWWLPPSWSAHSGIG